MKRRLKKGPIIFIVVLIIFIIGGCVGYKKYQEYQEYIHSDFYKLLQLGYNEKEIDNITKLKNVGHILKMDYNSKLNKIITQKYFIEKNLDTYIEYYQDHQDKSLEEVIATINVHADKEHYEDVKDTDVSKGNLMLVNKYHKLSEDYTPKEVTTISLKYAYPDNKLAKEVLDAYEKMWKSAKNEGITLIATSAYRTFESQERVYDNFLKNGEEYADNYAARPGFSEHQTGLSVDIFGYGTTKKTFEDSPSFTWLQENAHKYGFILRYPKGKENLTGYNYEAWHYRYVGVKDATRIKNEGITFDEYYAYYIENEG